MFVYSLSQCLAIKMTCTNTQTTGVSEHNYKICDTHYLDTVCQRIAISLLKPAFIMLRVTGVLAQAALGHYYHHTTWPVYGKSQNDSIKTPECKHQQQYSWERFHRYICEARDHEEELSNIRKKLYRSPHNRQAIYSPETWRTNKITRQLHQLAPHFTTLIHQQACFRDDFPCPHRHFHPPFVLYQLFSAVWSQLNLFSEVPPAKPQRCHPPSSAPHTGAPPFPVLMPPSGTPLVCFCEGCFPFCCLLERDLWGLDVAFCTVRPDIFGRAIPPRQEDRRSREKVASIFRESYKCVHVCTSCTFRNRLSTEHHISKSTWNVILSFEI